MLITTLFRRRHRTTVLGATLRVTHSPMPRVAMASLASLGLVAVLGFTRSTALALQEPSCDDYAIPQCGDTGGGGGSSVCFRCEDWVDYATYTYSHQDALTFNSKTHQGTLHSGTVRGSCDGAHDAYSQ
jgi:hypothetical protein